VMKTALMILIILFGFEIWRLSTPETVRLRQTWEFETTNGPIKVSNVIELKQWAAIPYLPGGTVGKAETIGQIPVSVTEAGERYFIGSDPRWLIGNALRSGRAAPRLSMDGITNEYTTGFISLLRKAKSAITVPIEGVGSVRNNLFLSTKGDAWGGLGGDRVPLTEFEATHSSFRLIAVTYRTTNDAVDR
jgi:hypothetical protein